MRVLFLDDKEIRVALAQSHWIKHELDCVATAPEAIQKLKEFKYDLVSLDHDLGDGAGNGYEVARFISEMELPPPIVVIHSFNPVGAGDMQKVIRNTRVIRVPFNYGNSF